MSDDRQYARFYYGDFIRDYPDIYRDDAAFACWVRLLGIADGLWPAPAELPRSVRPGPLRKLVERGLVTVENDYYRIKGLDTERSRRRDAARDAAAKRWQSARNADAYGSAVSNSMPSKAEQSKAEPSQAEQSRADDPADAYWSLTGRYPKDRTLSWIDELAERHGSTAVIKAMAEAHVADSTVATLLGRTGDLLSRQARELDRREAEEEKARLREKRAQPRQLEPWREEYRRRLEEGAA